MGLGWYPFVTKPRVDGVFFGTLSSLTLQQKLATTAAASAAAAAAAAAAVRASTSRSSRKL